MMRSEILCSRLIIIIILMSWQICFSSRFGIAQDSLSFSDCINIGLERNYALKIARNSEQIARNDYHYGHMQMLPAAEARGTISNSVVDSRQQLFFR